MTPTAYERLLDALRELGCVVRASGDSAASAQCPAHDDRAPSLSIRQIEGKALVYCHAGCHVDDVLAAANLQPADLFDEPSPGNVAGIPAHAVYRYDNGRSVVRSATKQFRQSGTSNPPELYRLSRVREAVARGEPVYVVEGEQDVHALESLGATATCNPMGAGKWGKVGDVSALHGAQVVVVADQDDAGAAHAADVAASLAQHAQVRVVAPASGKDAADHVAAGHGLDDFATTSESEAPPDDEAVGSSWRARDLLAVVEGLRDGTITRHAPSIGRLDNDTALFYRGKVNGVAGASGSGKSWTALVCSAQEAAAGEHVVYVDLEDDEIGVVGRLLALGLSVDDIVTRFHYVHPQEAYGTFAALELQVALEGLPQPPSLVVIDSTGEGMALDGAKPNDDDDTARWFRRLPAALAHLTGAAVLVLDHVVKADDGGLWPIGSQRKRAAISGAQYMQTTVRAFDQHTAGTAKLVCAKDRHGNYRPGSKAAELAVRPDLDRVTVELRAPADAPARASEEPTAFRPTALMEKVSRLLEAAAGPLSGRDVTASTPGTRQYVQQALEALVAEGYVTRSTGERRAQMHAVEHVYRQASDPRSDAFQGPRRDEWSSASPPIGRGGRRTHWMGEPTHSRHSADALPEHALTSEDVPTYSPTHSADSESSASAVRRQLCEVCSQGMSEERAAYGKTRCRDCDGVMGAAS